LNAFILRFAGAWRFFVSGPALVSQSLTRAADSAVPLKDQPIKIRPFVPLSCIAVWAIQDPAWAVTLTEDFSGDPQQAGWAVFGDPNLFVWNPAGENLQVTWDSTRPNSYFYRALGFTLTRYDDFSLEFDLRLGDIASGVEPGKTGPLQIGLGFLNFAQATGTNFMRGAWGGAPDVAEFAYYTEGYYDFGGMIFPSRPSSVPSFIPGTDSYAYAPAFISAFEGELPTNQTVHIRMVYSGADETAVLTVTSNGVTVGDFPPLELGSPANSQFTPADTFRVDTFSISSYSSAGDYYDSVLAHGAVDNLAVTARLRPIAHMVAGPDPGGVWQARFYAHSNWLYRLERSEDLSDWKPACPDVAGAEDYMLLRDSGQGFPTAFYRVRAQQP